MPGFLLHEGAIVLCAHGGQAAPVVLNPRVRVLGHPTVTQPPPYMVAGCGNPPQTGGPCVSASWVTGASRVKVMGQPVVLSDGAAICTPTGTPLQILVTQQRVKGR